MAFLTALTAMASAYSLASNIEGDKQATKARQKNAAEVEKKKAAALVKRKSLIDDQRMQMGIGGEGKYDTLNTSETGLDGTLQTLTGEVLG